MLPEPSKLNWSTVKPTLEEVRDKWILIFWRECATGSYRFIDNENMYKASFDQFFLRYAILDLSEPDPEPQPLWGVMPEIVNVGKKTVVCLVIPDKYYFEIQRFDRDEAINAWNKLAKPLNEIQP